MCFEYVRCTMYVCLNYLVEIPMIQLVWILLIFSLMSFFEQIDIFAQLVHSVHPGDTYWNYRLFIIIISFRVENNTKFSADFRWMIDFFLFFYNFSLILCFSNRLRHHFTMTVYSSHTMYVLCTMYVYTYVCIQCSMFKSFIKCRIVLSLHIYVVFFASHPSTQSFEKKFFCCFFVFTCFSFDSLLIYIYKYITISIGSHNNNEYNACQPAYFACLFYSSNSTKYVRWQ